jgi:hypothetical protein
MKFIFFILLIIQIFCNTQLHGGSAGRTLNNDKVEDDSKKSQPVLFPENKEVSANASVFDPKQEERVIMKRNEKESEIKNIKDYILNLKSNFNNLKTNLESRISQMQNIVNENLENKDKYQLTVSDLKLI